MKHERVMSIALVASMLLGNFTTSVPVFAADDTMDGSVQVSTETGNGISVEEKNSDIVVSKSEEADITIEQKASVNALVSLKDSEKEEFDTGKKAKLQIQAENKTQENAVLRLYFCDVEKKLPKDKSEWFSYLTKPATTVQVQGLDEDYSLPVYVQLDENVKKESQVQFLKAVKGVQVTSRYAQLELPAGATVEFSISLTSDSEAKIAVIPVSEYGDTTIYGEAASVAWTEPISIGNVLKGIVVGKEKQEDISVEEVQGTEEDADIQIQEPEITAEDAETESGIETEPEQDAETESGIETEPEQDAKTESGIETEPEEGSIQVEGPADTEHFLDTAKGVENLDAEQFATARLVVLAEKADDIIDTEHLIANYDNIYLLQYASVEQAMNAYLYYKDHVQAVEPDAAIETAEPAEKDGVETAEGTVPSEIEGLTVTEEENPVAMLSMAEASVPAQTEKQVIALIDTGTSESANVIDRVSLIDDVLVGGTHGDDMVTYITEENPDAKILSIRALGNDGYGSISAVVSAIEYAINSDVDIINLSMYSKKTLATSVLEAEIAKAIDAGIAVVGSAGNDGQDVADYVPGSIEDIWTIGAVDADGVRQQISNYGDLVDYYVVSESTSEAAARFSGYISSHGLESASEDSSGLIYTEAIEDGYVNDDIVIKDDVAEAEKDDDTIYDPVIENYVKNNVDHSYVGDGKLELVNVMDVNATIAAEEDLNPGETIDTLMAEGGEFRFLTQQVSMVPIYQFSEDSDYFVAFADVMHNDARAAIIDSALVHDNVYGEVVDGWHLDTETGLMYIPKSVFYDENGQYYFQYLKAQILYSISGYDMNTQWNSAVYSTTEETNGETETSVSGDDIFLQAMSVQVGKHMDVNHMLVTVNGFPIDGQLYAYDANSGILTIGFSSAAVQSVWVQAEKDKDAPEVEPGMKAAAGATEGSNASVSYSQMSAVQSKAISAQTSEVKKGYSSKSNAKLIYPEGSAVHSGVNAGGTQVFAYRGEMYSEDAAQGKIVNWIIRGGSGTVTQGGKVYNASSQAIFPFALKLSTISDEYIDFDELPYNLHLILECTHVNQSIGASFMPSSWQTGTVQIRCIAASYNSSGEGWAVFGVYTSQAAYTGQSGLGFFKVKLTPKTGAVKLTKRLVNAEFSSQSDRIYINTSFGIYKDKACKKLYTNDSFNGKVSIRGDKDDYAKSVTIKNLPPGTYYLKELGRCVGTIQHDVVYKFTVVAGKTTTKFIDTETNREWSYIQNFPFRGLFKIIKTDATTGEPLPGAVFRVKYYSTDKQPASTDKADRTWYFKSGEDGLAEYCQEDYLETWTNPDTGKTIKSDIPITITNGQWWLPPCYLIIEEIYAPEGYEVSPQEYRAEVRPDEATQQTNGVWTDIYCPTAEIKIENSIAGDVWNVRVQTKKINGANQGLEGAVFGVYKDEACVDEYVGNLISGPDGTTNILEVTDIPATQEEITLYLKEVEAPLGYTPTEEIFNLTFTKADYDKYVQETGDKTGELKIFGPEGGIVNEEGWRVRVNAKKIDSEGNPLAGAVIGVYRDTACTDEVGRLTSGDDGMTDILTVGAPMTQDTLDLYAREISAPEGYVVSNKIYHLIFTKAEYDKLVASGDETGELKTFGVDDMDSEDGTGDGIVNDKGWQVQVQLKKVDQDGNPVSGAVFGVYTDSVCTEEVGTLTSGENGESNVLTVAVPSDNLEQTLYCREKSAPEGYTVSTEVFELNFTKEAYDKLFEADKNTQGELKWFNDGEGIVNEKEPEEPTPTPPPEEPSGAGVYVVKSSTAAEEIMDLDSYELEGATFSVTGSNGFSGTLTTDVNGISNQLSLPDDSWYEYHDPVYDADGNYLYTPSPTLHTKTTTYTVRETKAPAGHQMNNQTKSFTVTMPYDKDKTIKIEFEDEPYFCKNELKLTKLGAKGEPIEGVVYKVEFFDAASADSSKLKKTWYLETDANGIIKMDEAHVASRLGFKSDPFYTHKGKIVIPIDGYLQFTEVAAPAEYVINEEPFGMATGETADLTKQVYNDLQHCRIRLKKYGADGTTPLAGVEFELKFLEESITATANKSPYFDRLLEEGKSVIYSTNDQGEVVFDNLDQGKYQITEVKTAPGQSLLKEPIIVTLPMTMTDEEADEYENVDFSTANFDESYTDAWFFYDCLYEITNTANFVIPTTGGLGTWTYGFVGAGVITALGAGLVGHEYLTRKRRRKKA